MKSTLIIFSSTDGHTLKICERIMGFEKNKDDSQIASISEAEHINISEFKRISNLYIPEESIESQWRTEELQEFLLVNYGIGNDIHSTVQNDKSLIPETITELITNKSIEVYKDKYDSFGETRLLLEKQVMLQVLDVHWKEHLAEIDHLRGSVGLRAYAQKNPKNEFKKEAYSMFESMLDEIDGGTVRILFSLPLNYLRTPS